MIIRSFVITSIIAVSATASAQPAGAQAEVLFRQGRELMAAGKLAEACAAFEQSQKLEPAPATLLNYAGCREKNGQLATAWGLFLDAERATRSATDDATKQLHDVAASRATALEPRVSKLAISVAAESQIDSLEISRNNERVDPALWNRALPVDGGTYTITAHAPGSAAWSTQVTIATESDTKTVDIPKLQGAASTVTPVKPVNPVKPPLEVHATTPHPILTPHRHASVVPVAVAGGAVVLAIGALTFELSGVQTYAEAKAETSNQTNRDDLYASANNAHLAAGLFTVGALAATGTTVWLTMRDHDREMPSPYVFVGGTILFGGAALAFDLWGGSAYDDAKHETANQARRDALYDGANSKRYAAAGLATAAIACAGVAVWRFTSNHHRETTTGTALVVAPRGIMLTGRFR
jgi:hypothetical protein